MNPDVDFTSPTRNVQPTVVYVDFVYVRFRFISSYYFPLIPKVHKIAVVSVAIHTFRNNYLSAVDNCFICSLLDKDFFFALLKKKKKKKKKKKLQDPTLIF